MIRSVLGIDVSPSACGIVQVPMRFARLANPWSAVRGETFGQKLQLCSTEDEIAEHIDAAVENVVEFIIRPRRQWKIIGVAFEQYAFGQSDAYSRHVAEVTGAIKLTLYRRGIPLYAVPSSSARKRIMGYNPTKRTRPGTKAKALVWEYLQSIGCSLRTLDEGDAFVAANWLVGELGGTSFIGAPPPGARSR